jgi:transposase
LLAALELREPPRRRLERSLALIGDFDREIELATSEIDALAKHDDRVEVLCQLRGVERYTAMLVIAEVGDVSRFGSTRKLCAWAGLTPTVRSSDGKARLGDITKQGSRPLRWALVEAAQHTGRGGGPLRDSFERIAKRRRRKIAKGRGRPQDPHPLLLRPARRRDPMHGGLKLRRSGELGILHGLRP